MFNYCLQLFVVRGKEVCWSAWKRSLLKFVSLGDNTVGEYIERDTLTHYHRNDETDQNNFYRKCNDYYAWMVAHIVETDSCNGKLV